MSERFNINGKLVSDALERLGILHADVAQELGITEINLNTKISRGRPFTHLEIEQLSKITRLTNAEIISTKETSSKKVSHNVDPNLLLDASEMAKHYEKFGNGSFVAIFSTDGFLEATDPVFFEMVAQAVEHGLHVFYIIPDGSGAGSSLNDYRDLRKRYRDRLKDDCHHRIHCYFVDNKIDLFAFSCRFVIMGDGIFTNNPKTLDVYIFISALKDYWIRLPIKDHSQFLYEVEESIDPVPFMPLDFQDNFWKLPKLIKQAYQNGFQGGERGYRDVRNALGTAATAQIVATIARDKFTDDDFDWGMTPLRWLDVGCEDGSNTQTIFSIIHQGGERQVALTAIDTSKAKVRSPLLNHAVYWTGEMGSVERFIAQSGKGESFDLITCMHSLYVVDASELVNIYRSISDIGLLVIVTSPFGTSDPSFAGQTGRNFINGITSIADRHIKDAASLRQHIDVCDRKFVADDPYRNYGEDIITAMIHFFGNPGNGWNASVRKNSVPSVDLLEKNGLSKLGRSIADFFTHGLEVDDSELYYRDVFELLNEMDDGGHLPADEIIIHLDKKALRLHHPNRPRFTGQRTSESKHVERRSDEPLLVFASDGGTCLDPIAKVLFEELCTKKGVRIDVQAASIMSGKRPLSVGAREVLTEHFGHDVLPGYKSSELDNEIAAAASLIIVMEQANLSQIRRQHPLYASKVRLMTSFDLEGDKVDIFNPYSEEELTNRAQKMRYEKAFSEIHESIYHGFDEILKAIEYKLS